MDSSHKRGASQAPSMIEQDEELLPELREQILDLQDRIRNFSFVPQSTVKPYTGVQLYGAPPEEEEEINRE